MGMSEEMEGPATQLSVRELDTIQHQIAERDNAGHDLYATREHLDDDAAHMDAYRAVGLAEGFEDGTIEEQLAAWQYIVDQNLTATLQGWFGRRAAELIAEGKIRPRDPVKAYIASPKLK